MTFAKIAMVASDLKKRRADANTSIEFAEKVLTDCVDTFCGQSKSSLRQMARDMGISAAYLSDIRRGNRKVSDAIVGKLGKLK